MTVQNKICPQCKILKSFSCFHKDRSRKDGLVSLCKECKNKKAQLYYINNTEQIIQKTKEYALQNKEMVTQIHRRKYLKNQNIILLNNKKKYYKNWEDTLYKSALSSAKRKKLAFDLTKDFINNLYSSQDQKCSLTKIPFEFNKTNFIRRPFAPSIDRINAKLGYTKDNVRLVCTIVNMALNEFGDGIFDKMCREYVKNTLCSS